MRRDTGVEVGLTIAVIGLQVFGVFLLGWPAGNILLLLWFENLLLTLMAVSRMVIFRKLPGGGWGKVLVTAFNLLSFCMLQLVFAGLLARGWGIAFTWAAIGVPAVLLVIRYVAESVGRGRAEESPRDFKQTYWFTLARIVVFNTPVVICCLLTVVGYGLIASGSLNIDPAVARGTIVAVLLGVKICVEIHFWPAIAGIGASSSQSREKVRTS